MCHAYHRAIWWLHQSTPAKTFQYIPTNWPPQFKQNPLWPISGHSSCPAAAVPPDIPAVPMAMRKTCHNRKTKHPKPQTWTWTTEGKYLALELGNPGVGRWVGQADTRWPAGLLTSAAAELRLPASFPFPSDGSWKIPFWQQLVSFCCCCLAFILLPRHSSWHCLQFSSIRFPTACRYLNKLPTNCAHTHSQSPFGGFPFPRPSKRGLVCVFTPCQMLRRSTHPSILVHPHRNGLAN